MGKHLFYVRFGIFAAVLFASQTAMADIIRDVPTLNEWGMLGSALVLGLAGAYSILKRKK